MGIPRVGAAWSPTVETWLGVDFSGNHRMWGPHAKATNVWVATVRTDERRAWLSGIAPVQDLPGSERPFDRLVTRLAAADYAAAAIDGPFSVPAEYCPDGTHEGLLAAALECQHPARPFPDAATFLAHLTPPVRPPGVKKYRAAETGWRVTVRSTTWAGVRGGTPMTAASITLLARAGRPIWPFADAALPGLIVEAFPAAQLKTWGLPFYGYNGNDRSPRLLRERILSDLGARLEVGEHHSVLAESADALDAVLCAFAGIAVKRGLLAREPRNPLSPEGWIAVHR